jgi:hypothetical protein
MKPPIPIVKKKSARKVNTAKIKYHANPIGREIFSLTRIIINGDYVPFEPNWWICFYLGYYSKKLPINSSKFYSRVIIFPSLR